MTITAPTPMIMPSMVSALRSALTLRAFSATCRLSTEKAPFGAAPRKAAAGSAKIAVMLPPPVAAPG